MIIEIFKTMRPKQWTKNLFVFAGIIFSQNLFNFPLLLKTALAFFVFCLLSGSIYIMNDIADLNEDRHHPLKSQRPLASGRLKVYYAMWVLIFISLFSLGISFRLSPLFFLVALAYFMLQLAYSLVLKHMVILDVFVVAIGFVLRVIGGAIVIDIPISPWLIVCTILLALFLSLSKRRHELVLLNEEAKNHRKILGEYSPYLLDQMISVVTASTVIAYCFYTLSEETVKKFGTKNLVFTIPFVLYGIFRYLYLIHKKELGGNPETVFINDRPLLIAVLLWVITVGIILYG